MCEFVEIDEKLFIGQGVQRRCYLYPGNENWCVKILHAPISCSYKRKNFREIIYCYFTRLRKPYLDCMSAYIKTVKTNLGYGFVFECIRDYDGKISKSLLQMLEDENFMLQNFDRIASAVRVFKKTLQDDALVMRNTNPANLLLKEISPQQSKFVLIDDWGTTAFIPLEYFVKILAIKKLERYWSRLANQIGNYKTQAAVRLSEIFKEKVPIPTTNANRSFL